MTDHTSDDINPITDRNTDHTSDGIDVNIVGCGIGGLTAAALAASRGLRVRLFDTRHTPGRAETRQHEGFALNRGPHALYRAGHLSRILSSLGIAPTGAVPKLGVGTVGQRVGAMPGTPSTVLRTRLLPARSKPRLARFMTAQLPRFNAEELATTTVDAWLDDVAAGHPELRTTLWGLLNLVTYNAASDIASADAAVEQLRLAADTGVIYVDRGWASIADGLRATLGPDVQHVAGEVIAVTEDDGATIVTTSDGRRLNAGTTIIAAGLPAVADRLLDTDGALVRAAGPPVEAATLDIGLRGNVGTPTRFGLDRALYASVHSIAAGIAPAGHSVLSVARYRQPDEDVDVRTSREQLRSFGREAGVDDSDVVMERYLHCVPVAGGMPTAANGGLSGRPPTTAPDRQRTFLVGDWVGDRGLLADAAAASAEDAIGGVGRVLTDRSATMAA
ncbi:MAG: NAD(P)-binding protein [Actinomycetota bacterium]